MFIWFIHPHPLGKKFIVRWTNKHLKESDVPISAIDSYYNHETGEFLLLNRDVKGEVKI
jgi:hypothetical protein